MVPTIIRPFRPVSDQSWIRMVSAPVGGLLPKRDSMRFILSGTGPNRPGLLRTGQRERRE